MLAAFALLILLPGRVSLPPLDRDESRYMEATSQMIASGNLVDVRFQDQPRYLQPAGIYWLEDAAVSAVDALAGSAAPRRQAWAYRIPSLAGAVANVLLTASLGSALFGAEVGFLAGLLLAASVLFNVEGRMATIDTVLLTAMLVAERALAAAWLDAGARRYTGWGVALAYWAAIGCGLMLKGPVVLIPTLGTLGALCLAERSWGMWRRMRPFAGVPLAVAIVLPWSLAILRVSHGAFFSTAIGHNLLGKVAGGQEAHGKPPGTYLLMFGASFWPGSVFSVGAIPFVWAGRRLRPVLFALAAILPTSLVFELIATKLPHYVLPTFPAIAVLTAASLLAPAMRVGRTGRVLGTAYAALWVAAGLAFAAAGPVLLWRLAGEVSAPAIAFALAGAALVVLAAWGLARGRRAGAARLAIGASFAIVTGLFLFAVPRLDVIWLSPRIAATMAQIRPCPASRLVSASFTEPSLVFLAGRDTLLTMPRAAAAEIGHDRCAVALVSARDERAFRSGLTGPVRKLGEVDGVNYSTGRQLALSFFAVAAPRP